MRHFRRSMSGGKSSSPPESVSPEQSIHLNDDIQQPTDYPRNFSPSSNSNPSISSNGSRRSLFPLTVGRLRQRSSSSSANSITTESSSQTSVTSQVSAGFGRFVDRAGALKRDVLEAQDTSGRLAVLESFSPSAANLVKQFIPDNDELEKKKKHALNTKSKELALVMSTTVGVCETFVKNMAKHEEVQRMDKDLEDLITQAKIIPECVKKQNTTVGLSGSRAGGDKAAIINALLGDNVVPYMEEEIQSPVLIEFIASPVGKPSEFKYSAETLYRGADSWGKVKTFLNDYEGECRDAVWNMCNQSFALEGSDSFENLLETITTEKIVERLGSNLLLTNDVTELRAYLNTRMFEQWPFVDRVAVHADYPTLNCGVHLIDIPEIDDELGYHGLRPKVPIVEALYHLYSSNIYESEITTNDAWQSLEKARQLLSVDYPLTPKASLIVACPKSPINIPTKERNDHPLKADVSNISFQAPHDQPQPNRPESQSGANPDEFILISWNRPEPTLKPTSNFASFFTHSGFKKLRSNMQILGRSYQINLLKNLFEKEMQGFTSLLKIWCNSKNGLTQKVIEDVDPCITEDDFKLNVRNIISDHLILLLEGQIAAWKSQLEDRKIETMECCKDIPMRKWKGLNPSTFKAALRKSALGNSHSDKDGTLHDLNGDLTAPLVKLYMEAQDTICGKGTQDGIFSGVKREIYQYIINIVQQDEIHGETILENVTRACDEWSKGVISILSQENINIGLKASVTSVMQEHYEECARKTAHDVGAGNFVGFCCSYLGTEVSEALPIIYEIHNRQIEEHLEDSISKLRGVPELINIYLSAIYREYQKTRPKETREIARSVEEQTMFTHAQAEVKRFLAFMRESESRALNPKSLTLQ